MMDTAPQIVPPFAPEERYVYSSATHPISALQGAQCGIVAHREPVGVGFPNPLGEENSPHDGYRAANCDAFSPRGATGEPGGTKTGT